MNKCQVYMFAYQSSLLISDSVCNYVVTLVNILGKQFKAHREGGLKNRKRLLTGTFRSIIPY